jgi:hypothetical protein
MVTICEERSTRCKDLECMTWAGAGMLWTLAGGIPRSTGLIGEAAGGDEGVSAFSKSATAISAYA